jgi:flagellar protein FliO/FliZ
MIGDVYWRFVGALVVVIGLILLLAWLAKRMGFGGRIATRRGKRRLSIQEVMSLDNKRRLVLLRRDGVEHLLLLGMNDDVVVESGIIPPFEEPDAATNAAGSGLNFAALLRGPRS